MIEDGTEDMVRWLRFIVIEDGDACDKDIRRPYRSLRRQVKAYMDDPNYW